MRKPTPPGDPLVALLLVIVIGFAAWLLAQLISSAFAQSSPGIFVGQVPTPQQWNSYFAAKQDYIPGLSNACTSTAKGLVPTPPGDPTQFLNGDCVWSPVSGLSPHAPVSLTTVGPLPSNVYNNGASGVGATLTGSSVGLLTVDGVTPSPGARVLVVAEATAANNGAYTVTVNSGGSAYVLTRAVDFNSPLTPGNLVPNSSFLTQGGNTLVNTTWIMTTVGSITVGSTPLNFVEFAAGNNFYSAGAGITLTGNAFSLSPIASATVLGNVGGGSAVPTGLSSAQLTTLCTLFTTSVSGCVPPPGSNPTFILSASGWVAPSSSSCGLFTPSASGCVPASGGGSANVLVSDGLWANGVANSTPATNIVWLVVNSASGGYNSGIELANSARSWEVMAAGAAGSGATNGDLGFYDVTLNRFRWSVESSGGLLGWPSSGNYPGAGSDLGAGTIDVPTSNGGYFFFAPGAPTGLDFNSVTTWQDNGGMRLRNLSSTILANLTNTPTIDDGYRNNLTAGTQIMRANGNWQVTNDVIQQVSYDDQIQPNSNTAIAATGVWNTGDDAVLVFTWGGGAHSASIGCTVNSNVGTYPNCVNPDNGWSGTDPRAVVSGLAYQMNRATASGVNVAQALSMGGLFYSDDQDQPFICLSGYECMQYLTTRTTFGGGFSITGSGTHPSQLTSGGPTNLLDGPIGLIMYRIPNHCSGAGCWNVGDAMQFIEWRNGYTDNAAAIQAFVTSNTNGTAELNFNFGDNQEFSVANGISLDPLGNNLFNFSGSGTLRLPSGGFIDVAGHGGITQSVTISGCTLTVMGGVITGSSC